jgi:hypothetical protein
MKTKIAQISLLVIALLLTAFPVRADDLEDNFRNPPDNTRPWCYWYWMSGNISKEGITRDLEAMSKVGIGSALIGNIGLTQPLKGSIKVLSEEWWDMMVHAVREAARTGVDIGVFNSPGWSQSGGPWIKPEQAMRYIVQSETVVKDPLKFSAKLPVPINPHFPALRSDPMALSGASSRKQIPAVLFDEPLVLERGKVQSCSARRLLLTWNIL